MFLRLPQPLFRAAFVVAVILVFILTMMPLPAQISVVSNQDKFEHAIAFCVLMLTGWSGWPARAPRIAAGLVAYGRWRCQANRRASPGLRRSGWW